MDERHWNDWYALGSALIAPGTLWLTGWGIAVGGSSGKLRFWIPASIIALAISLAGVLVILTTMYDWPIFRNLKWISSRPGLIVKIKGKPVWDPWKAGSSEYQTREPLGWAAVLGQPGKCGLGPQISSGGRVGLGKPASQLPQRLPGRNRNPREGGAGGLRRLEGCVERDVGHVFIESILDRKRKSDMAQLGWQILNHAAEECSGLHEALDGCVWLAEICRSSVNPIAPSVIATSKSWTFLSCAPVSFACRRSVPRSKPG